MKNYTDGIPRPGRVDLVAQVKTAPAGNRGLTAKTVEES